jgi:transposase InsO family protein
MKVSSSGYYAWRKRLSQPPNLRRQNLAQLVRNCYFENRRRYGARRISYSLQKAINKGLVKAGAIIHTDRGSQYASNKFRQLLQITGCRQSMSGKGNCYDNAQAESFFSRFKAELLEGGTFADLEEAKIEIFSYIESYYNRVRLHSSVGYLSPMEFEMELKLKMEESKDSYLSINT